MKSLHVQLAEKLVKIEEILTRNGNKMSEVTLFARNPQNDNQTVILSSEKSNDEIRKAFEIVMRSATQKSEISHSDVLKNSL